MTSATQATETEINRIKKARTPATDYREFLRAIRRGKWSYDDLTLDQDWPGDLATFVATIGEEGYVEMIERALTKGDLTDEGVVTEKVMKRRADESPTSPAIPSFSPKMAGNSNVEVKPVPPPSPVPEKTPEQLQQLVEQMVRENGRNVMEWGNRDEVLARYDLKRSEVTDRMVDRADQALRKEAEREMADDRVYRRNVEKMKEKHRKLNDRKENRLKVVWEGDEVLDPELNPDHPIPGTAAYRQEMENREEKAKRERLEKLRAEKNGEKHNDDGDGHIMVEGDHHTLIHEGENEMKVSKKIARELLVAVGFEAERWSVKKLTEVFNDAEKLAEAFENEKDLTEDQCAKFRTIANAVTEGKKITVVEGETKPSSSSTAKKTDGPGKKRGGGRKKKEGELSCVDAVAKVLAETKKESMSATEITERMLEKGYWSTSGKTPVATVGARIYTEIQKLGKESRFEQVSRGQFALRK